MEQNTILQVKAIKSGKKRKKNKSLCLETKQQWKEKQWEKYKNENCGGG